MRISTTAYALMVAILVSLPLSTAAGQLGFALGVKQPNGACKNHDDYAADMDAIRRTSGSTIIRIFDASECDVTARMLPAAKAKGFQAILGIWYAIVSDGQRLIADNTTGLRLTTSITPANTPS